MRTLLMALTLTLSATGASASEWIFAEINGQAASASATLSFAANGTISGSTGCNAFSGTARAADGQLQVGKGLAMTRRACPGEGLATQEKRITTLLQGEVSMQPDPFADTLILTGNGVTATLTPGAGIAAQETSGSAYVIVSGVDATLNIRAEASTRSGVVSHAALGQIMKNLGCEERSDRTWCRIAYVDASGLEGWAAAEYLSAATATRRAGAELFDEIGRLQCRPALDAGMVKCDYGVAREADGSGAILVYLPENQRLLLEFRGAEVSGVSNDGGEAQVSRETDAGLVVSADQSEVTVPMAVLGLR
ncbi:hypothetical protein A8B76_17455 [Roseovarius indicus]|nr:hypothetical protein A8B76_17455 [Roseovarius indicus]